MLAHHPRIAEFWQTEKIATLESLIVAKEEALSVLARERESILRMSREDAINQLITDRNINGRERVIRAVNDTGILGIG